MNKNEANTSLSGKTEDQYQPKKDNSLRYMYLTVLGLFVGIGLTLFFYSYTLIDFVDLSKFIVGFGIMGFLIPLKYYQKWFHFIKYEMIIFNIIGVAPLATGLFLCLNFTLDVNQNAQDYKIVDFYISGEGNNQSMGLVLENNAFSGVDKIIELNETNPNDFLLNTHLRVTLADGLFGFEVIKQRDFISK